MNEIIYKKSYSEYKAELDQELGKTAETFVRIGYLLKVARDTDILKESGYSSVVEFAQNEYSIDKTQVSRFIHINDKFSEGGYSDHLLAEYQGFGYSKLTLMLAIPEEINVELSPAYTREEIKAIKEEIEEENKISDIEVMLEERNDEDTEIAERVIKELLHTNIELYEELCKNILTIKEAICPDEEQTYSVRVPGIGRIMMMIKAQSEDVALVNVRTNEKEIVSWKHTEELIYSRLVMQGSMISNWEEMFHEPYPKKEKVAPVQPVNTESEQKKEEPKEEKKSKVQKAKVEYAWGVKKDEKVEYEKPEVIEAPPAEDFMPVPEGLEEVVQDEEAPEDKAELEEESKVAADEENNLVANYKLGIKEDLQRLQTMIEFDRWQEAESATKNILFKLEQITTINGTNRR